MSDAAGDALATTLLESGARRIAFLGLAKNVGKTTALVATLASLQRRGVAAGTTSAGRDGEAFDAITGEPKPRFRIWRGQLVASATSTFESASFASSEIATLDFPTRFGRIMLRRADGEGEIEVIGPSTVSQLAKTAAALEAVGAEVVLLDGAIGRRAFACGRVADGIVLSVGMAAGESLDSVMAATRGALELIRLRRPDPDAKLRVCDGALTGAVLRERPPQPGRDAHRPRLHGDLSLARGAPRPGPARRGPGGARTGAAARADGQSHGAHPPSPAGGAVLPGRRRRGGRDAGLRPPG